jgi:hypothetical protein
MAEYNQTDTKRADGCYVRFERVIQHDVSAHPSDYLFQDEDYREQDQARLDAWKRDEWSFIGIRARATVLVVRGGTGTYYTITSVGRWSIASDSNEEYLSEIFAEEREVLLDDLRAMGNPIVEG